MAIQLSNEGRGELWTRISHVGCGWLHGHLSLERSLQHAEWCHPQRVRALIQGGSVRRPRGTRPLSPDRTG